MCLDNLILSRFCAHKRCAHAMCMNQGVDTSVLKSDLHYWGYAYYFSVMMCPHPILVAGMRTCFVRAVGKFS